MVIRLGMSAPLAAVALPAAADLAAALTTPDSTSACPATALSITDFTATNPATALEASFPEISPSPGTGLSIEVGPGFPELPGLEVFSAICPEASVLPTLAVQPIFPAAVQSAVSVLFLDILPSAFGVVLLPLVFLLAVDLVITAGEDIVGSAPLPVALQFQTVAVQPFEAQFSVVPQ